MSWLSAGVGAYIRSPDGGRHRGVSFRKPGKPGKILFAIIGVTSFMLCPTGTALMWHTTHVFWQIGGPFMGGGTALRKTG